MPLMPAAPRRLGLALLAGLLLWPAGGVVAAPQRLLVFAAASTTEAMSELGTAFARQSGVAVVNSFAASSTLAKQIELGAPADVYLSANIKWMDYLQRVGVINPVTRVNLARNRLVLIAPARSAVKAVTLSQGLGLSRWLGGGRLAMGDPAHVPAGIYAHQALAALGIWPRVKGRIAAAANVRAALALVQAGEAPLGVVYSTDAALTRGVRVVARFAESSHDPIVYPAALVAGRERPEARAYLRFLASPAARAVFAEHGFVTD